MKTKYLVLTLGICLLPFLLIAKTFSIDLDQYIVKNGDIFLLQLLSTDSLNVKSPVLPTGVLSLYPFADTVMVAGKTLADVYKSIEKKLGSYTNTNKILYNLFWVAPTRFHVMGAVVRPGEYVSEELITLQQGLVLSLGLSSSASKKIKILRNKQVLEYDLTNYYANNDLSENPLIMHDDVIIVGLAEKYVKVYTNNDTLNYVESAELLENKGKISDILMQLSLKHQWSDLFQFTVDRQGEVLTVDRDFELEPFDNLFIPVEDLYIYVTGNVAKPGKYPYNGNMDARQYISRASGPTKEGHREKVLLMREQGKFERYKGQTLLPGDTLYVPESIKSTVISYITPLATVVSMVSTIVLLALRF